MRDLIPDIIPDLGPHAAYILACYAITALVLAGLVAWLVLDGRHQQRLLDALDARGVRRRSGGSASKG
ncbi:MAG TPA: heme exporter protein CcmD [Hyphomicrobiaceae bacterium]|jgi:heme exporter protein D|nr:heme exporter protein CcmD [Hyphomicrobiaceae bacterium]